MLYLIKSYTKGGPILKVGYASDIDKRMISYKTHNPGHKLLWTREGDEILEDSFHRYFFLYSYKNFPEWFIYEEEIIRVFKEEPNEYFSDSINPSYKSNFKDKIELYCMKLIQDYPHLSEFFRKFYLEISTKKEKMKYLCEFLRGHQEFTEEVLLNIPLAYKNYYTVLGPDRCYAFNYRMSLLEKEYQKQLNNQSVSSINLRNLIYDSFKEGERYTNVDLKLIVQKIYDYIGLKKTGKASDFEEWFEMKKCLITNPITKKRENGFELIKRKRG